VWFVEALFPGYVFAQFLFSELHRQVNAVPGVSSIVRFGQLIALIEDAIIEELRAAAGEGETILLEPQLNPGDSVEIATGPFKGLTALVTQYFPAQQRVKVLLEFLGRSVEALLPSPHVIPNAPARTLHEGIRKDGN
jgi:transcription antitermination factor NusG